jgi:hypothetical protein
MRMEWGSGALALACLAVGMLHLVRLAVLRRDVAGEASHAAMGLGMAAMASPFGNPVPEPGWTAVFVLSAAWFGALALRTRCVGGETVHHVVGSGAMLFMLAAGHSGEHAGHGGGIEDPLGLVPVTAIALAGYFTWHALRCADRHRSPPVAAGGPVAVRAPALSLRTPQAAAVAHLVAAAAMAFMLLTVL